MAAEPASQKAKNFSAISPRPMAREAEMAMRRRLSSATSEGLTGFPRRVSLTRWMRHQLIKEKNRIKLS